MSQRNTFDYPGSHDTSFDRQDIVDRNRNRTILWVVLALVVLAVIYFAASASWQTGDSSLPTEPPATQMTVPAPPAGGINPPANPAPPAPLMPSPTTPATPGNSGAPAPAQ